MRHRKKQKKFGRIKKQRNAFSKLLASNLIIKGSIRTTEARAKALRPFLEKIISRALLKNASVKRFTKGILSEKAQKKLYSDRLAPLQGRKGGYFRITRLGRRKQDNAPIVRIDFTS